MEIKEDLHRKGYYEGVRDLQPVSSYLESVEAQRMIGQIASSLSIFESRMKKRVTPASVTSFAAQFPLELQDATLCWLQHIELIDPHHLLIAALEKIITNDAFASAKNVALCPLGSLTDSSHHLGYGLRNVQEAFPTKFLRHSDLSLALSQHCDGYILFDDNTNSGLQAINTMAELVGVDLPDYLRLDETHAQRLSEQQKAELLSKPLGLAFAVAVEDACTNVVEKLRELFGFSEGLVACHAGKTLWRKDKIFSGDTSPFRHEFREELRAFLSNVATSILLRENHSLESAAAKALGFRNAEAMIVLPYNSPTMTITPLWISGDVDGVQWNPLVARARRHH